MEKERRSGSLRTVEGYSRMLQHFFGRVGKAPDQVTAQEVFVWAHGKGLSGKDPSPVTIGARMACLSSFFRFLIRMDIVQRNPCDRLERPRTSTPPARGLSAEEVRRLLAVIPDTPPGLRDRAIILTLVLTGRRRAEVFRHDRRRPQLRERRLLLRVRGQGREDRTPRAAPSGAGRAHEPHWRPTGASLSTCPPMNRCGPLRPPRTGKDCAAPPFTVASVGIWRRPVFPPPGCTFFVTSAAKLRRDAGESIEDVSRFLDHSSLAVTTTYLRRLEGQEDQAGARWRRR